MTEPTSGPPSDGLDDADRAFASADVVGAAEVEFDRAAIKARYLEERDKRLVAGRADIRELETDEYFAAFRKDPFREVEERDAITDEVDVVIVGGGIAGVLVGANLRQVGVEKIRIIDEAGGIGGTWYWNQYPGVMCDVESYIYMPMLEELDYVPTQRYAQGEEIRTHLDAIADRFDLKANALFHTRVRRAEWVDDERRWKVQTDRGDVVTCRWYVVCTGILNLMKLPALPGMESFAGQSFHTARWDYSYTGGSGSEPLDKLSDKTVALVGTGASAIQALAPLAESAKHVYVFQRTPSAIGVRGNRPTEPAFAERLKPNWQQERMDNFQALMLGVPVDGDLVDDGWTHHYALARNPPRPPDLPRTEYARNAEEVDFRIMEAHRQRVVDTVGDSATAEILKPQYRYLCKRPCFHDEYLPAFNRPNVTLIDNPAGIERITPSGLVVNGEEFQVDCIIYATGFEAELTPLSRRVHHNLVGKNGLDLETKWSGGAATLFGMLIRGFPNMFVMPAPGQQAVVTVNYTQLAVLGAEFIGRMVAKLEQHGIDAFEVSEEGEESWNRQIVEKFVDASSFMATCTPSRLNFEGHPEQANPRDGNYGGGIGDWFGYRQVLHDWLKSDSFEGLDVTAQAASA